MRPPCKQTRPLQRSLIGCKVHAAAFVSVVSAVCLVRFLTLVNNLPISQRASTARISFPLLPCAWILFAAFVSVVSWSLPVSGCKVTTFIPNHQIFSVKKYETLKKIVVFLFTITTIVPPYSSARLLCGLAPCAFFEKEKCLYNKVLKKIFS